MSDFIDEVTDQLNLRWAWDKVRREATPGDIWFDEIEAAGFDLELERNLQSIASEFRKGRYKLAPLKPLPFPKQQDNEGKPRLRQAFQVSVRDQVAWTAIVNVIGPYVDSKIPAWSYGNRLYRSIWVEEDKEGVKHRKIGRYRHASGHLYLPFGQSWPIFRRHVYLATRAMTTEKGLPDMDEQTKEELELQERLVNEEYRCPFVLRKYWQGKRPRRPKAELYWCSIDLKKFYPTLKVSVVQENIVEQLPFEWKHDAMRLLGSMLKFRLDLSEWSAKELKSMDIRANWKKFPHIPTGLYVAGFLANAGLLKVDFEVVNLLKERKVGHFRFVDDHIILSYNLDELIQWVNDYSEVLQRTKTGTKINLDKIEPVELRGLLSKGKQFPKGKNLDEVRESAKKACCLDPKFPSPLMTKTLALVSGIARTDFNLLEAGELAAMTDQLEHLLLVELREEEMPVKTRLSFAATRLSRIVECRLANDESIATLGCRRQTLTTELDHNNLAEEKRKRLEQELDSLEKDLSKEEDRLKHEVQRAFQLIRKVLREKPDRVRLWTRAVLMCRLTGVKGLADLQDDIRSEQKENPLAAEYLRANMLALLGSQALIAARILRDEEVAHWRKKAARAFLEDVQSTKFETQDKKEARWFLRMSWHQYCFGLHCSDLALRDESTQDEIPTVVPYPEELLAIGKQCIEEGRMGHSPEKWSWWAGRMTLRDLSPQASSFVKTLGKSLKPSREAYAFWRFFPLDVPTRLLISMAQSKNRPVDTETMAGWWFDALRARQNREKPMRLISHKGIAGRMYHVLTIKRLETISLYEWCDYIQQLVTDGSTDPRCGEWTALEIVRQIGALISKETTLSLSYLRDARRSAAHLLSMHPANFRIPREWIVLKEPTWIEWRDTMRKKGRAKGIIYISKKYRIVDNRYTPLNADSSRLFVSVNPVRGLGLLLYGLLKKSFDLPSLWNGPGHAYILNMMPKLLLIDMTCSSWTLGILQGCLQPRVTENLFLQGVPEYGPLDNDTLHDPLSFYLAKEVVSSIKTCQTILEGCQLSTLGHKARQLTPVNVQQLTEPNWTKVFGDETSLGGINE
jgi:hypothetical protein